MNMNHIRTVIGFSLVGTLAVSMVMHPVYTFCVCVVITGIRQFIKVTKEKKQD